MLKTIVYLGGHNAHYMDWGVSRGQRRSFSIDTFIQHIRDAFQRRQGVLLEMQPGDNSKYQFIIQRTTKKIGGIRQIIVGEVNHWMLMMNEGPTSPDYLARECRENVNIWTMMLLAEVINRLFYNSKMPACYYDFDKFGVDQDTYNRLAKQRQRARPLPIHILHTPDEST